MVVALYLLLFPGLFVIGCVHLYRVRRRYDLFLDGTGKFPQPTLDDMMAFGPVRTTLLAIGRSDEADRRVQAGEFGPEPLRLHREEIRARILAVVLLVIGVVGIFVLTPLLANVTSRTGTSSDVISLIVFIWLAALLAMALMLKGALRLGRSRVGRILSLEYLVGVAIVLASALFLSVRLLGG